MLYKAQNVSGGLWDPDAVGLNATDQIVGGSPFEETAKYQGITYKLTYAAFIELTLGTTKSIKPAGAAFSCLNAINDAGIAVGTWIDPKGAHHAFIYDSGVLTPLDPILGSSWSDANDINNDGHIVGAAVFDATADESRMHAFLYDAAASPKVRDLGVFDGHSASAAAALNETDQVVGWSGDYWGPSYRPFIWSDGGMGELTGEPGVALDINDAGHVVGSPTGFVSSSSVSEPYIWRAGEREIIPINGVGESINNHDQVVGYAMGPGATNFGFVCDGGVAYNLNDIVVGAPGLDIIIARDINDKGHIVASGLAKSWWAGYALLLSPAVIGPFSLGPPPLWKFRDPFSWLPLEWAKWYLGEGPPPIPPVRPRTPPEPP